MARAFGGKIFAQPLEFLAGLVLAAPQFDQPFLRCAYLGAKLLRRTLGLGKCCFCRAETLGQRRNFRFNRSQGSRALFFGSRVPGCGFIRLLRFGLLARRFLHQPVGDLPQLRDAIFQVLLCGHAARGVFRRFAQSRFERRGLLPQSRDRFAMRGHARRQFVELAFGDFNFHGETRGTGLNLRSLFAVKRNPIFGAIEVQRGLPQEVLGLAQFGIEFVTACAESLLLSFEFVYRSCFASFRQVHLAQQCFDARGFDVQMFSFAGQHAAQ